jgi:hypothetical protein
MENHNNNDNSPHASSTPYQPWFQEIEKESTPSVYTINSSSFRSSNSSSIATTITLSVNDFLIIR